MPLASAAMSLAGIATRCSAAESCLATAAATSGRRHDGLRSRPAASDSSFATSASGLSAESTQFHRPVGHAPRRHRSGGRLLEDGVRVDAAEAERIHRGAARLPRRHHPRRDAGVDVERGLVDAQFRVDLFAQGRRQRAVVQRQRHLDQAGDARGRDAVADHRLHRAQRLGPDRGAAFAEHRAERRDFGLVAERDAGAVRLDQVDRPGSTPVPA